MNLLPASTYVRELRAQLPASTFAPARSRVLWLPVHLSVIAACMWAVTASVLPMWLIPIAVVMIGLSFGGIAFLAHETLHGGVVKGRMLRDAIGWVGFLPFAVSPRLWRVWHNREHHAHTNHPTLDPDKYPILQVYQSSRAVRVITDTFSLGGRRLSGLLSVAFGFTGQSTKILLDAHKRGWMTKREHQVALLQSAAAVTVWTALAFLIGIQAFLLCYAIPLVIANMMLMSYILTNHGLNPLTDINDPLANSLSVTVPRAWEVLTLGFGYHVEHHLFPAMSTRHAPAVRAMLLARWPERYQSMPLSQALVALHHTSRVYRDAVTLTDPRSGATWPTLLPREVTN